jgi:hypothetical protein
MISGASRASERSEPHAKHPSTTDRACLGRQAEVEPDRRRRRGPNPNSRQNAGHPTARSSHPQGREAAMTIVSQSRVFVGVDVSKDTLDIQILAVIKGSLPILTDCGRRASPVGAMKQGHGQFRGEEKKWAQRLLNLK